MDRERVKLIGVITSQAAFGDGSLIPKINCSIPSTIVKLLLEKLSTVARSNASDSGGVTCTVDGHSDPLMEDGSDGSVIRIWNLGGASKL